MTTQHALAGVYAAAVTPLKPDSTLDLDSVPALLTFFASRGCHGILLFGTTGEGPSFSPTEREMWMRAMSECRSLVPDLRIIVGTGTPSISETVDLTKLAFDLGFDGVLSVPPYYFRKATDDGLFKWFSELIHKAIPSNGYLLGYHFPSVAGIGFSIELLSRLKDAFPMQFAGLKDSSHDADLARTLGETFGSDLAVFTGTDSYMQFALQNHAAGCITAPANVLSPGLREIWDLMNAGKDATEAQAHVKKQRDIIDKYPPFPPTLKALLHRLHRLPRWNVKAPLLELAPELEEKVVREFEGIG